MSRNLCITYNNKDPVLMTAFTQALLEVHYTKKESISEFIQLLTDANRVYDINLGRFFSYVLLLLFFPLVCTYWFKRCFHGRMEKVASIWHSYGFA